MRIKAPTLPPRPADGKAQRSPFLWALRAAWVLLPILSGPLFGDALDPMSGAFRRATSVALWALWAAGTVMTLVPHPRSLTAIRVLATGAVPFALWALVYGPTDGWAIVGFAAVLIASACAMLPQVAAIFVDGESYGDERRLPLRPPAAALWGPLPVAWMLTVAGSTLGPLLIASGRWAIGVPLAAVGWILAVVGVRSLHALTRRFLVFVPAGLVVHDLISLTDPVLFRREDLQVIGPAFTDSVAKDLTLGASGLVLEARFTSPLAVPLRTAPVRIARRKPPPPEEPTEVRAVLISPSQPGEVLAEATRRTLPVG